MVGAKSTVLQWFASYLKKRTFSVNLGHCSWSSAPVLFGVPSHFSHVQHFISLLCRWFSAVPSSKAGHCCVWCVIGMRVTSRGGWQIIFCC